MSDKALLVRNDAKLAIALSAEGIELRDAALAKSGLIGRVSNAEEQQRAVDAQKLLYEFRKAVEKSRVLVKAPVLAFAKTIDDIAKEAGKEVAEEEIRVSTLVADFQALELAKIRAKEAAEKAELEAAERERQKALAEAKSHEEVDAIQADFSHRQQEMQRPALPPPKAVGQSVREVWDYEVTNINLLAEKHRGYVNIEPRRADIIAALNQGFIFEGLRAFKTCKSGVR